MQKKQFHAIIAIAVITLVLAIIILALPNHSHSSQHNHHAHHSSDEDHHQHSHGDKHEHHTPGDTNHSDAITLSDSVINTHNITIETAQLSHPPLLINLPGEIAFNNNKTAHVIPRINGIVTSVFKREGDKVEKGELLGVIDSREFAELQGTYLAAKHKEKLARTTLLREKKLWQQQSTAELDYLRAEQTLAEAEVQRITYEQQLLTLGLTQQQLQQIRNTMRSAAQLEIRAPQSGTIINRHLTLGEAIQSDDIIFVIANTNHLWGNIDIYPKDLPFITVGQSVAITSPLTQSKDKGKIEFIAANVNKTNQTVQARVEINNTDNQWRAGEFVTFTVITDKRENTQPVLTVPQKAIHQYENNTVIFIKENNMFSPRKITTGQQINHHVVITNGLISGEEYAVENSFLIKAELGKSNVAHDH